MLLMTKPRNTMPMSWNANKKPRPGSVAGAKSPNPTVRMDLGCVWSAKGVKLVRGRITHDISVIQGICIGEPFYGGKDPRTTSEPKEESRRLENESPLIVIECELLRVVTSEISNYVHG